MTIAKGFVPILFTAAGVTVAGIVGYGFFKSQPLNEEASVILSDKTSEASNKTVEQESTVSSVPALRPTPTPNSKPEPTTVIKETQSVSPSFDIVRVERDGNAVIAGKAKANETISLLDGDKLIAETKTNSTGEFAIVLDTPLEAGGHQLYLKSKPKQGEAVQSSSLAIIDIPEPKAIGNVTVLLADVGKPSKILQTAKPKVRPNKVVSSTAQVSVSLAKPETIVSEDLLQVKIAPVLIEAADVEAKNIFIAGRGEPEVQVNLYFDNQFAGSTKVAKNGAFLFEIEKEIKSGRYDIRVDMTKVDSAEVISRAEVVLVHETKIAKNIEVDVIKLDDETIDVKQAQGPQKIDQKQAPKAEPVKAVEQVSKPAVKAEIVSGSAVIIRQGDSLWTVARRNYGAGIRYTTIFDANRDQVGDPHKIYPGQVLKIPETVQSLN